MEMSQEEMPARSPSSAHNLEITNEMIDRKYRITLKDTLTGDTRTFEQSMSDDTPQAADHVMEYLWNDGNYGCDCNRSLFLWQFDDNKQLPCDFLKNRIELVELEPIT